MSIVFSNDFPYHLLGKTLANMMCSTLVHMLRSLTYIFIRKDDTHLPQEDFLEVVYCWNNTTLSM